MSSEDATPAPEEKVETVDLTDVTDWPEVTYDPHPDARTYHSFTVALPGGGSYRLSETQFRTLAEDSARLLKWLNEEAS